MRKNIKRKKQKFFQIYNFLKYVRANKNSIFFGEAWIENKNCPNCWASRAKQDGLTHCAYCGFGFVSVELWNWIFIKKEDNSKK